MIQADDRLKGIFDEALKLARANKHEYITLEHLLTVLTAQPEIHEMMTKSEDINYEQLVADLDEHIRIKLNEIVSKDEVYPKRTQSTERTVNRAFTQAIFSGHDSVNCFHLLNAIFNEKNSHACYYLQKNGVTKKQVVDYTVEHGLDSNDDMMSR